LHQFIGVIVLNPLFESLETEFLVVCSLSYPLEVVDKNLSTILFFENAVYEMAAEELELHLTS